MITFIARLLQERQANKVFQQLEEAGVTGAEMNKRLEELIEWDRSGRAETRDRSAALVRE